MNNFEEQLQAAIDQKTKPLGALGRLEAVAFHIGRWQQTLTPSLNNPHMVVFAGDHGIARDGVSAYPSEVTAQMVLNFCRGGAAINVFCRQHGIALKIVDAGVAADLPEHSDLINAKVAPGTQSFLTQAAMTTVQCDQAMAQGRAIVKDIAAQGCNVIGFGEMGIGNTSAASVLTQVLANISLEDCVGRGTGLNDVQHQHKVEILTQARDHHALTAEKPLDVLATFGGFEMAMMVGAMQQAAASRMLILVDGFIATAAFLVVYCQDESIKEGAIFCHQSHEQGHQRLLAYLGVEPLLDLSMRLGEGTGVAVAYPLIRSAVHFLNDMASFTDAGVSTKSS